MATVIGTDLSTIAQAVEQALLDAENIGDISNVYWVEDGELPPPGITGQRDILLYQSDDDFAGSDGPTVIGSGRGAAIKSGLRVAVRTSLASDRTNTRRDWFIAHAPIINAINDTLMLFFPEDADHNALTIEGFIPVRFTSPERHKDVVTWGRTVCAYEFHYLPGVHGVTP